ncbi:MAG: hypothetical protein D6731_21925 [Planctomycetota bacterium]|nr:MAG: hypothetical protein D6731_21925 [Planctomycetota bacterium]
MGSEGQEHGVRVGGSRLRCPYCHDEVDVDGEAWLACAACLARHHEVCWTEARGCASCGEEQALGRVATPGAGPPRLRPLGEPRRETRATAFLGFPKRALERRFAGEATLSDAAWLDATIRRAVKQKGRVALEQGALVWRPERPDLCRAGGLSVTLAAQEGTTTLRLEDDPSDFAMLAVALALSGVAFVLAPLVTARFLLLAPLLLGGVALGLWFLRRAYLRRRDALLERLLEKVSQGLLWSPAPPRRPAGPGGKESDPAATSEPAEGA